MKKYGLKKRKLNNDGMTLIEILIAMVILTVVLVPMLYSFVRVSIFNLKSRDLQQATVVAQTVMENCKAYSMEDIQDLTMVQKSFYSGVANDAVYYTHNPAADGESIEYVMTGVDVENKEYDIFLKLTPYKDASGVAYKKDIMTLDNMNAALDAVFIEESTLDVNSKTVQNIEDDAYAAILSQISAGIRESYKDAVGEEFYNEKVPDESIFYPESVIEESFYGSDSSDPNYGNLTVRRNIYLVTNKDAMTGEESASVTYNYYYELAGNKYTYRALDTDNTEKDFEWTGWLGTDSDSNGVSEVTYGATFTVYSNGATNDATHPTKLEKAYLFYYPLYNDESCNVPPCTKDTFVLSNNIDRQIDVYLLKQRNPAIADINVLNTAEATYGTSISNTVSSKQINLYHNMNVNISGLTGGVPGTSMINMITPSTASTEYVKKENKSLMYNIEVKVYNVGSYDVTNKVMTGSPVLTLDGTKVDW